MTYHKGRFFLAGIAPTTLLALLLGCANSAMQSPSSATTGEIAGFARYSGQSNDGGITITADSTSGGMTATVLRMLGRSVGAARTLAAQATTDSAGAYTLTSLAAGTYTVYASSQNSLEKAVTTSVAVTAGKTVSASDLTLTPTGSIAGIANINGATSGNLGIVVYIAGTSYAAMTDATGAYTITGVPVGTGYTLVASLANYGSATTTVAVTAGAATTAATLSLGTQPDLLFALSLQTYGQSANLTVPGYWRNGTVTLLPTTTAAPNGGANGVTANGTDIYIAGFLQNGATASSQIPVYWKNGTMSALTLPTNAYGWAKGLTIDPSSNILVTGAVYSTATNNPQPGYWKNGTWIPLSMSLSNGDGTAPWGETFHGGMYISANGDVYVGGSLQDPVLNYSVPVYWKNGVPAVLPSVAGTQGGYVDSMDIGSASVFYATGALQDSNGPVPAYWINGGEPTVLPMDGLSTTTANGETWGPDFIGTDIYSMGMVGTWNSGTSNMPVYWKNWKLQTLPVPPGIGGLGGYSGWAYIVGSDIYIGGTLSSASGLNIPVYWKNGKVNVLDIGTYAGASENMTILSF
jgi:hypothetical protein